MTQIPFDDEAWKQLPALLDHLPNPVRIHLWADKDGTVDENHALNLVSLLSDNFSTVEFQLFPRRSNYSFYPVFGVMGVEEDRTIDYGIRIIGLPIGYQMTSLITAIQSAAFKGMTSEALSRIQLAKLEKDIALELITDGEDEMGPVMAQIIFNFAVISPFIKSYLIMGNSFQDAYVRYSINYLPHVVINERYHVEGAATEGELLEDIAKCLKGA